MSGNKAFLVERSFHGASKSLLPARVSGLPQYSLPRSVSNMRSSLNPLIERALDGLRLRFANNPNWPKGMGSSITVGVSALGSGLDGAFILPGDMPLVPAALLERPIEEFVQAHGASIIFPATTSGAQRNPVLWPRRFRVIEVA